MGEIGPRRTAVFIGQACRWEYTRHGFAFNNARPEGATAHSPGQAKRHPGSRIAIALTPCKGKSTRC